MVVVVVVCGADGASALVDVWAGTQMVAVRDVSNGVVHVDVRANIRLAELVEDGPGSLGVDG